MPLHVTSAQDLYHLKDQSGLDSVQIDLSAVKYAGLAHHAVRLAFFAVKQGGEIVLTDRGVTKLQSIGPHLIRWPTLRALALRALAKECDVTHSALGEVRLTRRAPLPGPGWSAGIIFSGRDTELPAFYKCLDGLCAQPELVGPAGEILVCGPTRDMAFLADYPMVRYVVFDLDENDSHFPISRKKNALMAQMQHDKRMVLHCRIVLDPGALAKAPTDFDILGPNVVHRSDRGVRANVGYVAIDPLWPAMVPARFERSTLNVAPERYLDLLRRRKPYVDGAAFAVTKRVLDLCTLDNALRWGDCEDVEWCMRAQAHGFLVDMAPSMIAENAAPKVNTLEWLPQPVAQALREARRVTRRMTNLRERYLSR